MRVCARTDTRRGYPWSLTLVGGGCAGSRARRTCTRSSLASQRCATAASRSETSSSPSTPTRSPRLPSHARLRSAGVCFHAALSGRDWVRVRQAMTTRP
eukprot:1411814-Rhodomonas_salina.1